MKIILHAGRSGNLTLAWEAENPSHLNSRTRFAPFGLDRRALYRIAHWLLPMALVVLVGCRAGPAGTKKDEFFTSGSREADQRASQKMAKAEQLSGSGEGAGERGTTKKEKPSSGSTNANTAVQVESKLALFDRLGGEAGLTAIVDDFLPRALNDPRVNWARTGSSRGKFFSRDKTDVWAATPENVSRIKKHFIQFLALATGGPSRYEGNEMKTVHAGMKVANPEFDAVVGDLKVSLDRLRIPNKEQRELLSIIESTRPQIVTER